MTRDAPAGTARDGKGDQRPAVGAAPGGQRERGLLALYLANGISALGTRMSFLAVPWFVLTSTGRAVEAGLVGFAEMAPYVAVQALGGPAVDRLGVRRTSIATDLLATVTVGLAAMILVTNTLDQAQATVLTPTWATRIAGSSLALGLVAGGFSAGAVTGNLLLSWLGPRLPRRLTYGIGFLLAGAPRYLAMALCTTVSPVLAVAVAAGVGAGSLNPVLGAVEYERIPRPMQPRVLGALGAIAWAGIPIGSLAGGTLTDHLGLRPTLLLAGATYLVTTLAPFVFPAWRGMNRTPSSAPTSQPDQR